MVRLISTYLQSRDTKKAKKTPIQTLQSENGAEFLRHFQFVTGEFPSGLFAFEQTMLLLLLQQLFIEETIWNIRTIEE